MNKYQRLISVLEALVGAEIGVYLIARNLITGTLKKISGEFLEVELCEHQILQFELRDLVAFSFDKTESIEIIKDVPRVQWVSAEAQQKTFYGILGGIWDEYVMLDHGDKIILVNRLYFAPVIRGGDSVRIGMEQQQAEEQKLFASNRHAAEIKNEQTQEAAPTEEDNVEIIEIDEFEDQEDSEEIPIEVHETFTVQDEDSLDDEPELEMEEDEFEDEETIEIDLSSSSDVGLESTEPEAEDEEEESLDGQPLFEEENEAQEEMGIEEEQPEDAVIQVELQQNDVPGITDATDHEDLEEEASEEELMDDEEFLETMESVISEFIQELDSLDFDEEMDFVVDEDATEDEAGIDEEFIEAVEAVKVEDIEEAVVEAELVEETAVETEEVETIMEQNDAGSPTPDAYEEDLVEAEEPI
ncbi:hypothetical protein D9X91_22145, partial [Falsibacillus albus]